MATRATRLLLLALAWVPLPLFSEPAPRGTLVLEPTFVNRNLRLILRGTVDLPDGARLMFHGRRLEGGKPAVTGAWQLMAEVKDRAFEVERIGARATFRPGRYAVDAALAENQREAVASAITDAHRRVRLAGTVDLGGDLPLHWGAVDLAKPVVTGFREAVATPAQAAAAAARLEKALARKELPYYLPSATLLLTMLDRVRKAAPSAPAPAADGPTLPTNDEVTRGLRPVFLDGLEMFVVAVGDLTESYTMMDNNQVRTVLAMTPEKRLAASQKAAQLAGAWTAFKALPWLDAMPPALQQKMDEIAQDVNLLPTVRFKSEGPEKETKDKKPPAPSVESVLSRLYEQVGAFRTAVAAEQAAAAKR
jgi:hypothetical protein